MKAMRSKRVMGVAALTLLAITAAACGSDAKSTPAGSAGAAPSGAKVGVSLILKNTTNQFFVSMQKSAQDEADKIGVSLTVAAGTKDGDTATQITAIEAAISKKDKGILITPNGDDVVPAIKKARDAGLLVIALDTPPNPASSVDITFATDNYLAGQLIGKWTSAKLGGKPATIAMLDLFNDKVVSVDTHRDQGFLNGMGIVAKEDPSGNGKEPASGKYAGGGTYTIVCHEPTDGAADKGKTAMENCLSKNKDINVVYTINEPAAQGADQALKAAGVTGAIIVSVDGGCKPGLELVASKVIGATAQQYPGQMATKGMQAIKDLADGKAKPAVTPGLDFFNTGTALVTDDKQAGVDSISIADGQKICWGV